MYWYIYIDMIYIIHTYIYMYICFSLYQDPRCFALKLSITPGSSVKGSPMVTFGFRMIFQRYSHDIPEIFPWYSRDIPMIFQRYSHDIPEIFPWYSRDIPMIFQRYSHDIPMIFQRYSHDIPEIFPWYSRDIPMIFQRYSMIFQRYSHDIPEIFPWYSRDIPMIFLSSNMEHFPNDGTHIWPQVPRNSSRPPPRWCQDLWRYAKTRPAGVRRGC